MMTKKIKNLIAQCRLNKDYFIDHCVDVSEIKKLMERLYEEGQQIVIRTPDGITITISNNDNKRTTKVDWTGGSN